MDDKVRLADSGGNMQVKRCLACAGLAMAFAVSSAAALAQDTAASAQAQPDAQNLANQTAAVALAQAKANLAATMLTVPSPGFTGAVTANQTPATAESNILYSRLLPDIAGKIGGKIHASCATLKNPADQSLRIFLYTGADKRTRSDYNNFLEMLSRYWIISTDASMAFAKLNDPLGIRPKVFAQPKDAAIFPGPAAGAALSLLSLFKSDYALGGTALTPTDQQLANIVAARIVASAQNDSPKPSVYLLSDYTPKLDQMNVLEPLTRLDNKMLQLTNKMSTVNNWIAFLTATINDPTQIKPYVDVAIKLQAVINDYQAWLKALGAVDSNGDALLNRINTQALLAQAGTCTAYLHVDSAATSNYAKRNLWTGFGGMPFYVSAEATVSWRVWNADGAVLDGGLETGVKPFIRLDAIDKP